ncbi:MAG: hypothetical protein FWE02_05875 [Defluviitaleaceae bacterium]|nr:hypothetical protein [Defluviitaleaceae bacterium]
MAIFRIQRLQAEFENEDNHDFEVRLLYMFVKSTEWINRSIKEAEVVVSDGNNEILCFSHPFLGEVGGIVSEPLYCLDAEDIVLLDDEIYSIKSSDSYFRHTICGKIIDNNIVSIGEIRLSLEGSYIPGDIKNGDFITFETLRVDIYDNPDPPKIKERRKIILD